MIIQWVDDVYLELSSEVPSECLRILRELHFLGFPVVSDGVLKVIVTIIRQGLDNDVLYTDNPILGSSGSGGTNGDDAGTATQLDLLGKPT